MGFDPYHKWLGIPPTEQPPNHYRLLGIASFESDLEVIESAANRQMAYVQTFANSQHAAESQRVLNELAAARLCLLNARSREAYNKALQGRVGQGRSISGHDAQSIEKAEKPRPSLPVVATSIAEIDSLMIRAKEAHDQKRWETAIDLTSRVIKSDPKRTNAYILRAAILRRQNRDDRALADLAVASRLAPDSPHLHIVRAEILITLNRFDQAITELTHAIELDPNNIDAIALRCECRRSIGDREGAEEDAEELARLDPTRRVRSRTPDGLISGPASEQPRSQNVPTIRREGDTSFSGSALPLNPPRPVRKPMMREQRAESFTEIYEEQFETSPGLLPRYRPEKPTTKTLFPTLTIALCCVTACLICGFLWGKREEVPSNSPEPYPTNLESIQPPTIAILKENVTPAADGRTAETQIENASDLNRPVPVQTQIEDASEPNRSVPSEEHTAEFQTEKESDPNRPVLFENRTDSQVSVSGAYKKYIVRFDKPNALDQFVFSNKNGRAYTQDSALRIVSSDPWEFRGGGHATFRTSFTRYKSVRLAGRFVKPSSHEFRFCVGQLNGILLWQGAHNEHHFRVANGPKEVRTEIINPNDRMDILVEQFTPDTATVRVNGSLLFTARTRLKGAVTIYTAGNEIAIEEISIEGIPNTKQAVRSVPFDYLW